MSDPNKPAATILVTRTERADPSKPIMGVVHYGGNTCCCLEPSRTKPVHEGHPCVPEGTYKLKITFSPHMQYNTPEVFGVPGRNEIRIHKGNFSKDSLGCLLLGKNYGADGDSVEHSADAFAPLLAWLTDRESQGLETVLTIV